MVNLSFCQSNKSATSKPTASSVEHVCILSPAAFAPAKLMTELVVPLSRCPLLQPGKQAGLSQPDRNQPLRLVASI